MKEVCSKVELKQKHCWVAYSPSLIIKEVYAYEDRKSDDTYTGFYNLYYKDFNDKLIYLGTESSDYLFNTKEEAIKKLKSMINEQIKKLQYYIDDCRKKKEILVEKLFILHNED
jgi:hypothetical protein